MRRKYILYCILMAMISLCGCSSSSTTGSRNIAEIKQEEISYVAQPISLPEYGSFDGAYSDGNTLYYAAATLNSASQQYETSFYTLKKDAAAPEINFSLAENQRVLKMTMDEDGNIYYLGYEEALQEDSMGQAAAPSMFYKLDSKGLVLLELDLSEYTKGPEQAIIYDMEIDGENRIVLCTSDQKVYVLDPDGSLLFETRAEGRIYSICRVGKKVFAAYDSAAGMRIGEIDIPGKKLLSASTGNIPGEQFHMTSNRNNDLLIATESSVYKYDFETQEAIKKFDWKTYDSVGTTAGILLPFGENGVMALSRNYTVFPVTAEITAFREAREGETAVPEKIILTLGVDWRPSTAINTEIAAFNKKNPEYKIEVKNYEEDYSRLHMEIMAGKGPDLVALRSYRIDQLAAKGILMDLNPYLDADETLDRSDFMENVLNAFETEGHLYGMPFSFRIDALVGKASLLGDRSGWNLDEMLSFAESFPEGTDIFADTSKSGVLRLLKRAYTKKLVDSERTDSPLDRELLIKMLEFANRYENDDTYVYDNMLDVRASDGQLQLLDVYVFSGICYRACADSVFGEPVVFIGYPTENGNGNLIDSAWSFGLCSSSSYKDVGWKFISTLMSKEAQSKVDGDSLGTGGAPVRKDALAVQFEHEKQWEYNDYLVRRNDNFKRERFDLATEKDIAPGHDLMKIVDTALRVSPDIDEIIEEEAAHYFDGTKPVEEVVDVIENRIRTYVNENK